MAKASSHMGLVGGGERGTKATSEMEPRMDSGHTSIRMGDSLLDNTGLVGDKMSKIDSIITVFRR